MTFFRVKNILNVFIKNIFYPITFFIIFVTADMTINFTTPDF